MGFSFTELLLVDMNFSHFSHRHASQELWEFRAKGLLLLPGRRICVQVQAVF